MSGRSSTKAKLTKQLSAELLNLSMKMPKRKTRLLIISRQFIAIYQVEATLGKIVNVILHEGSKPLAYFHNQISNLEYWYKSFQKTGDPDEFEKIMRIAKGMVHNADVFVRLFRRLDPLAARRNTVRKPLELKKTIQGVLSIFEQEIEADNISVEINGPDDSKFPARIQDMYSIFTNLIDNSLYWIREKKVSIRQITIELKTEGDTLRYIDYRDTGPGIESDLIESEVIFAPGFTTKPDGTGLGLAIAGEAADRNDLRLEVYGTDEGAHFRLQPKMKGEK